MPRSLSLLVLIVFLICFVPTLHGQEATLTAAPPVVQAFQPNYPDTTSGLEHLAKDVMKAQKENDAVRAGQILASLILPQPRQWYERVFGVTIGGNDGALYERASASVPATLAKEFVRAAQLEPDSVVARRFDRNCDDNAGEYTFGILHARLESVPLYEIRFFKGSQLFRLFSFAFVDGAFRFILTPKLEGPVFSRSAHGIGSNAQKPTQGEKPERVDRLAIGGNVQAAHLIHRENPVYPEDARREHLQGTVNLHALIGKDGSVENLYVLKGYCSLAEASLRSVQKWRYSPTLLEGSPVEVDTQIVVIFQLSGVN